LLELDPQLPHLIELPVNPQLLERLVPGLRVYAMGDCRVLVSRDATPTGQRWHLSISHPDRYPTWEEIKKARYQLLPLDIVMVQVLPPPGDYVNIHPNTFHLWETFDRAVAVG